MKALIVGGDSCIGRALSGVLIPHVKRIIVTSRRQQSPFPVYVDLAEHIPKLPECDVAFLCAGIKGFKECERDPMSYRVNVDGILAVGKQLMRAGTFVVYVSTDAVEWSDMAYARQRAMAEIGLQAMGDPAIVRCQRFDEATAPRAAAALIEVALGRKVGIHHWSAATDARRMAA